MVEGVGARTICRGLEQPEICAEPDVPLPWRRRKKPALTVYILSRPPRPPLDRPSLETDGESDGKKHQNSRQGMIVFPSSRKRGLQGGGKKGKAQTSGGGPSVWATEGR